MVGPAVITRVLTKRGRRVRIRGRDVMTEAGQRERERDLEMLH